LRWDGSTGCAQSDSRLEWSIDAARNCWSLRLAHAGNKLPVDSGTGLPTKYNNEQFLQPLVVNGKLWGGQKE